MRLTLRTILVTFISFAAVSAQDRSVTPPASVTAEGLPPIPERVADRLAPYGRFGRTYMLSWHPSRKELLVSTSAGGASQLHVVASPGAPPVALTSVAEGVSGPALFGAAGEDAIVFRNDPTRKETHQLWRLDRGATSPVMLTDGTSRNGIPVQSPRSGRLAFDSNRRNGKDRDLYVLDPRDPSSSKLVAQVSGIWEAAAWSSDDRTLLVREMLPGTETALWSVDVESGERKRLTPEEPATWSDPQIAPDGRSIYAVSNLGSELPRVWRRTGDTWTPLTRDGDSIEAISLSPDGATLAVSVDRDASSRLELIDTSTFAVRLHPKLPAGQIAPLGTPRGAPALQWHRDGTEVAFTFGSVGTMGDAYSVHATGGDVTRWTTSAVGGVDPTTLPDPEIVQWKSFDGRMISGVLYRPPARFKGPRPVIVNIHGGPSDVRERPRFQGRSAYFLAELGVAIIYPNVRGSFGFGRSFERLDDGRKREDAVKDIGALLDWIATQPGLDAKRVMVTGASYGGYMTYAAALRYPDRIRCAFAGAAISHFPTLLETTEAGRRDDRRAEYGDERDPEMRRFLDSISPLTSAAKLRVPLLIAHGRQDVRVPVAQAESMYAAVRKNGTPAWLIIYEDAGHENFPGSAANQNFNFYAWIAFVERYLLGAG